MRALVTGAAGFVGRHFARDLARRGWWVLGVDISPEPDGFPGTFVRADIRDVLPRDGRAADAGRFDLVVHAAAIVGGRLTIDGQPLKVASDLAIDSDLFQWAVRTKPGRVLYFSSSAAYPVKLQDGRPHGRVHVGGTRLREDHIDLGKPRQPDQSYGWVKLTGERLAELARAEGVPVTVVRPFSGYGADQGAEYPFPAFIARAKVCGEQAPPSRFDVWGDGRQTRDFVHIDDVVAACFAVMDSGTMNPVNIGTGRAVSFNLLAEMVLEAVNAPRGAVRTELVHDLTKPVGVQYRVADTTRLHTHYTPKVRLEEGIYRALRGTR